MSDQSWIPEPGEDSRPFFDGAREGKLRLQVCSDCGTWAYPVTTFCSECGSTSMTWKDASGEGTVYAHGRLQRAYHPRHKDRLPLIVARVDIAEGLRLMTNIIEAEAGGIKAGDAVVAAFETFPDGGVLPVFKPA